MAPMSECHLLLGRPWQFDHDATHGGRSNNYSFVHRSVHHVLKSMLESAIKVDALPVVRKKRKDPPMDTPKPRMALPQGEGNDVAIAGQKVIPSNSETTCKAPNDFFIKVGSINIILNEKNSDEILANLLHQVFLKMLI